MKLTTLKTEEKEANTFQRTVGRRDPGMPLAKAFTGVQHAGVHTAALFLNPTKEGDEALNREREREGKQRTLLPPLPQPLLWRLVGRCGSPRPVKATEKKVTRAYSWKLKWDFLKMQVCGVGAMV